MRGAPWGTGRGGTETRLYAIHSHSVDEPLLEGAMIMAVSRLFPVESPPRYFSTTRYLADSFEPDHQAVEEIVLMTGAYSGGTVGRYTPSRWLRAGGM